MNNAEIVEKAKDDIKAAMQLIEDIDARLLLEEALMYLDSVS